MAQTRKQRKKQTFEEEITQLVVPVSERNDVMHGFHTNIPRSLWIL